MKKALLILSLVLFSWCSVNVTNENIKKKTWNLVNDETWIFTETKDNNDIIKEENKYSFLYEYSRFNKWNIEINNKEKIFTNDTWLWLEIYKEPLNYDNIDTLIAWIFRPDTYYADGYIYLNDWEYGTWYFPIDKDSFKMETKEDSEWYNFRIISDKNYYYQLIMYWNRYEQNDFYEVIRIKK